MNTRAIEAQYTLPVYPQLDFVPVSGSGASLRDANGREVLDLYGGHAVAALGYDHPALLQAVTQQLETLPFQSNIVANPIRATAAQALVQFSPSHLSHAFFVNSGAEANENALRLAFKKPGGRHVVAVEHGFHGRTTAAAAVTWGARDKWYAFPGAPFEVSFVPRDDLAAARSACRPDTAAVIVEPVQGVAGAYDLQPEFLQALAASAREHGALFIADEVQCGMGRTGLPFAITHAGVEADIVTAAKSLGGGVACGAVLTTDAIAAECHAGDLGTTFGGGPLAAAAIQAVIQTIINENLMDNARERAAQIRAECVVGPVTAIQGKGMLLGLRCRPPAREVRDGLLAADILTGLSADPHVLRLLPPLNLHPNHIDQLKTALLALPNGNA